MEDSHQRAAGRRVRESAGNRPGRSAGMTTHDERRHDDRMTNISHDDRPGMTTHDRMTHDGMTMRTCYVHPPTRSIADLTPECWSENELWKDFWLITRINVPLGHRGKGLGSHLLKQVIADADRYEIPLALNPVSSATPGNGLSQKDLVEWYVRYGFNFVGQYMVRYPSVLARFLD